MSEQVTGEAQIAEARSKAIVEKQATQACTLHCQSPTGPQVGHQDYDQQREDQIQKAARSVYGTEYVVHPDGASLGE